MTFLEWVTQQYPEQFIPTNQLLLLRAGWNAAQAAERERIKSRVSSAAESLWCIRNQVGDEPYGLYIGPSLNTLEQFVEKLMEET